MKIEYENAGYSAELVSKGNSLRETLSKAVEGDDVYKLLGVTTKKMIYPREIKVITPKVKPARILKEELSLEEMTYNQKGFFGNLNNLEKLDYLERFNNRFSVLEDPVVKENSILIMVAKTVDSLGRIIIEKVGVTFRRYTNEEKEEYLNKLAAKEAESLGMAADTSLDDLYADTDF